ncbi:MAG: hypothetical protein FE78DRAFT_335899 [Acidomyces sp. 'richmondensis']|nr:MAG: hypothetical protein FE78DRAFT_335899 [Acidomyces sp. 'richmondensis']
MYIPSIDACRAVLRSSHLRNVLASKYPSSPPSPSLSLYTYTYLYIFALFLYWRILLNMTPVIRSNRLRNLFVCPCYPCVHFLRSKGICSADDLVPEDCLAAITEHLAKLSSLPLPMELPSGSIGTPI